MLAFKKRSLIPNRSKVEWEANGKQIFFENSYGLSSHIVGNHECIGLDFALNEAWTNQQVSIFDPNGHLKFTLPSEQIINRQLQSGLYQWFEVNKEGSTNFDILFETLAGQWRLTIVSNTGKCIACHGTAESSNAVISTIHNQTDSINKRTSSKVPTFPQ